MANVFEFIDDPVYVHGFPWRKILEYDITTELQKLRTKINNSDSKILPYSLSHIGYKCSDKFFQYERLNTRSNTNICCVEYWQKRKEKIIEYWTKQQTSKDLFGTIVFMKRAPSHFSPYVAGMVYKYFNAKKILDPYSGWGDSSIAAIALDIEYVGIDSNPNLISAYKSMIDFFGATKIKFICDKSENVNIDYQPDLIFSSPPFWEINS